MIFTMRSVNLNANPRENFSAIFIRRYSWVRASMKVTILFGDTADAAAKPQGRLRFSFGSVVSKSAMRCRDAKLRYTRCILRYGICERFMGTLKSSMF